MKFSGKMSQLLLGILGFSVALGIFNLLQPQIIQAAITQIAQALSPEEVNLRAKQVTVRIDGANTGSGAIVDYSNKVYTVLTNWHVMKNPGDYVVQTIDGRQHQVNPASIKQLPGLDLAILKFNSDENYQVAETGNSSDLNEGQSIYFAGYPGELRTEDNRYYRFFTASLVGILPKSTDNGYSLIYSGEAFPGMSGGPVYNQKGLMIGIHGEANINAISGGTSNYGIPINSYKSAIAKLNNPTPSTASTPTTEDVASQPKVEPTPEPAPAQPNNNQPETSTSNSGEISSVPTFTSEKPKTPETQAKPEATNESQSKTPEVEKQPEEATKPEPETPEVEKQPEEATKPEPETPEVEKQPEVATNPEPSPAASEEVDMPATSKPVSLISSKTGIDYTKLRDLLKEKKWSEADIHTYQLVEQIIKTAKQQNKHVFIELKTIAQFSCPDIRTIDNLWEKYSDDKFGFSSQQKIWQSVNQKGDYSTETWRKFATKVGWKKGDVINGSGYLLYDELNFDPSKAPQGQLPWWFALPDEEQKVIKQLFASCNFNPSVEELKAEAERDNPKKSPENASSNTSNNQPNINKAPKSF